MNSKFTVSKGSAKEKQNYLFVIDSNGIGEASGSVHYGPTHEQVRAELETAKKELGNHRDLSLSELSMAIPSEISNVAKAAVVNAMVHHWAAMKRQYPWEILNIEPPPNKIKTSFTIGIGEQDKMLDAIASSKYPILKLKLGFDGDIEFLKKLIDFNLSKIFRIDVNGAWSPETMEEALHYIRKLDVEIVEQPTDLDFVTEWRYIKLRSRYSGAIFIDEGLNDCDDYEKYSDFVDGINIKMAKSGGLLEAVRLCQRAQKDKMPVMLGCMIDSTVGLLPAFYLAALAKYYDLDSPLLIANDIADTLVYNNNSITLSDDFKTGPRLSNEDILSE